MSIIGFDLDDVILDFNSMFKRTYKKVYNVDLEEPINRGSASCHYEEIYNVPEQNVVRIITTILGSNMVKEFPFVPGSIEVLNNHFRDKPLLIITKRYPETKSFIEEHLHNNLTVPEIEVCCTTDPFIEKYKILAKKGSIYFIDDKLETICYLLRKKIHAILFKSWSNRVFSNLVSKTFSLYPSVLENWNEVDIFLRNIL